MLERLQDKSPLGAPPEDWDEKGEPGNCPKNDHGEVVEHGDTSVGVRRVSQEMLADEKIVEEIGYED